MSFAYSDAVVEIAAWDAPDSTAGLATKPGHALSITQICVQGLHDMSAINITLQGSFHWSKLTESAPSQTRLPRWGWALQGYLLPPRIFYVYRERTVMRCFERERLIGCKWMLPYLDSKLHSVSEQGTMRKDLLGVLDLSTLLFQWYAVLCEYSRRSLKKSSDRAPALSGIARLAGLSFADHLHTKYLAGLCSHDILRGLAWRTTCPYKVDVAGQQRAPSSTYLNIQTPVFFDIDFPDHRPEEWELYAQVLA